MEKSKKSQKHKNVLIKKASIDYVKYVPIVYPIIVFLGYLNYDFYYKKFNINIFNFFEVSR